MQTANRQDSFWHARQPDKCAELPMIRPHRRFTGRSRSLAAILSGSSCIFREMPGVTPGAQIGAQFFGRIGGCDLVCRGRQRFSFAGVLPLPADRTFGFVVHHDPFGKFFIAAIASLAFAMFRRGGAFSDFRFNRDRSPGGVFRRGRPWPS